VFSNKKISFKLGQNLKLLVVAFGSMTPYVYLKSFFCSNSSPTTEARVRAPAGAFVEDEVDLGQVSLHSDAPDVIQTRVLPDIFRVHQLQVLFG
jgi:hypothetical protein